MNRIKGWIGELTDITVALVALGVAAGVVLVWMYHSWALSWVTWST